MEILVREIVLNVYSKLDDKYPFMLFICLTDNYLDH